jgi:hypothetical protein
MELALWMFSFSLRALVRASLRRARRKRSRPGREIKGANDQYQYFANVGLKFNLKLRGATQSLKPGELGISDNSPEQELFGGGPLRPKEKKKYQRQGWDSTMTFDSRNHSICDKRISLDSTALTTRPP